MVVNGLSALFAQKRHFFFSSKEEEKERKAGSHLVVRDRSVPQIVDAEGLQSETEHEPEEGTHSEWGTWSFEERLTLSHNQKTHPAKFQVGPSRKCAGRLKRV